MTEPGDLVGAEGLDTALARVRSAAQPRGEITGWATVELDRAEIEVPLILALGTPVVEAAGDERILGGRCRILRFGGGARHLILEPSTEGRLAAALARHGEGNLVRYLVVDAGAPERVRRAGFTLTTTRPGPLGQERLVVIGPRDGPFLLLAGLD